MELNPNIEDILKEFKIDKSEGTLCLLAIYYKLDAEKMCSENTIKAINLTKIVEKLYPSGAIKWNMPLFKGQQTEWDWVREWNNKWNINMSRKDGNPDVLKRMQEFFKKYPRYRMSDVMTATDNYILSVNDPQYLKSSAKFIFDGAGAMKKSMLLSYLEKLELGTGTASTGMRGKIIK